MGSWRCATDASETYSNGLAGLAAIRAFEGAGALSERQDLVLVDSAGGDFTDIMIPASDMLPSFGNELGIIGENFPKSTRGATGQNLRLDLDYCIVDGIEFENDDAGCIDVGRATAGANVIVRNNLLHGFDNGTGAILIRGRAAFGSNLLVYDNILHTTITDALRIEADGNLAYNNVFYNLNATGIAVSGVGADNTELYFNSLLGRAGNAGGGIHVDNVGATGVKIKNNIAHSFLINYILYRNAVGLQFDYNDTWNSTLGGGIEYRDLAIPANYTFANWVALGGGISQNDINADPLYANVGAGTEDLHIQGASPCIGAGVAIVGITTDFDGDLRGDPPDIGMDETPAAPEAASSGGTGNVTPALLVLEHLSENIEAQRGALHGFDSDVSGDWLPVSVNADGELEVV